MQHPTRVGKYEIEAFLGGGMSHVYRAKDTVLGRRVAIKLMTDASLKDLEAKAGFLQEARTASSLNHENIISIFDFGEDFSGDDEQKRGRPFMVMEYVEGESLREAIKTQKTGDLVHRLRLALQAARALEYIHSRKIVHRDIKPENLHIDLGGKVRLMDFGVAKPDFDATKAVAPPNDRDDEPTAPLAVGTPFYMSPEQVLGCEPTPLTDVYAYGLMVYELLTEQRPVPGKTVEEIFHHILYDPLSPEPLEAAKVPQAVRDLVGQCTSKQLIQRPQGMNVVCQTLEKLLGPSSIIEPYVEPAIPGLLSPSFQRPESTTRLKMTAPPPSFAGGNMSVIDPMKTGEHTPAVSAKSPVTAAKKEEKPGFWSKLKSK